MKQKIIIKPLLFTAALALGLVAPARADDSALALQTPAETGSASTPLGLLGQAQGTLTYGYINLADTSAHADRYTLELNQPLAFGLDGVFTYDYTRSSAIAGSHVSEHEIGAALRAFSVAYNWGKPYVEAGIGQVWSRFAGARDSSFVWQAAAGVEFQVASRATVTPYVQYEHATDYASKGVWNAGVKGSYWIDRSWAVTAGFERDDEQNSAFTVGTNFRF